MPCLCTDSVADQNILLYQRLTHVLSSLTESVETELQRRMDELDRRSQRSAEAVESLGPRIDRLVEGLHQADTLLSGHLEAALRRSTDSVDHSLQHAHSLQQALEILVKSALEGSANLAREHQVSLEQTSKMAADEMSAMVMAVATVASSSIALQEHIVSCGPLEI